MDMDNIYRKVREAQELTPLLINAMKRVQVEHEYPVHDGGKHWDIMTQLKPMSDLEAHLCVKELATAMFKITNDYLWNYICLEIERLSQ